MALELKTSDVIRDCEEWKACYEAMEWLESYPRATITASDCPSKEWTAWYLYRAGKYWPDDRHTEAIASALTTTGNSWYLYLACRYWPDSRYTDMIANALISTGNSWYLYLAGRNWPSDRYTDRIANALVATRDDYYINKAKSDWPKVRANALWLRASPVVKYYKKLVAWLKGKVKK